MAECINLIVLLKIELEDPLENLGVKLVRQAGARTNDIAGDGCTTSIILARGLIAEGMKVCPSFLVLVFYNVKSGNRE
jgi:chaperonin GroEL (HSP60 family)